MKKDKLNELECNLSRLNKNIENYNKLDLKYKSSVKELGELKDYVKSVDGYIVDLEGKVNTLIIGKILGHRSQATTAKYVHENKDTLLDIVENLAL